MKLFKRWQKSAGKAAEHGNTESKIDSADAPTADLENNDTESASKLDMSPMDVVESDAEAAVSSEFVLPTPAPEMPSEPVRES